MKIVPILFVVAMLAGSAQAADLTVSVRGADGKPVSDAVVTVYPNGQPTKGPIKFDWPYRVAQQNIQFNAVRADRARGGRRIVPQFR
jgi:hypothetical protein